ncbi:MAG: STAS domain-containing protein, partial [Terriglobales bacterium]
MTSGIVSATDLQITLDETSEGTLVRLRGHLGIDSSPAFRDRLLAVLQGQSMETVAVDLTEVSYLDTSGIATLVEGLKVARSRRNTLRIQGLQGRVLHLFEVTGLLDIF